MPLQPTEPLELHHSWPMLFQTHQKFDLGLLHDGQPVGEIGSPRSHFTEQRLARLGIGLWECDLRYNALTWSDTVYDIFGFPRNARISRGDTVMLYREHSRAAMERLRAHAIKHRRGFTLDVDIRTARGDRRWVRLTAAPVCENGRVVRLRGQKQIITGQ